MLSIFLALSVVTTGPPKLPETSSGEVPAPHSEPEPRAPEVESPDSTDPAVPDDAGGIEPPDEEEPAIEAPAEAAVELRPRLADEGSRTTAPGGCPCQPGDRACRQSNTSSCSDGIADPSSASTGPERPYGLDSTPSDGAPTMSERGRQGDHESLSAGLDEVNGAMLQMGFGVGGCWQVTCSANPISLIVHGGLGYRGGRWAVGARVAGGGGPLTDGEGSLRLLEVDVGLEFFPARTHTFDPYLGIGLGYLRVLENTLATTVDDEDVKLWFSRGAVRASAGWPFWLSERWSVGPRFDYTWGFAGNLCVEFAGVDRDCDSVSTVLDDVVGTDDTVARRSFRREETPRPWMLSLELRHQF